MAISDAPLVRGMLAGREFSWRVRPGQGPTVVLMAGCGLSQDFWAPVVELLDARQVVSYDRPGMGASRWPGELPCLSEEVASLTELVERCGAPAVLVAHSMAAFHAEALCRVRPDLVEKLVLVDPSVEWPVTSPGQRGHWPAWLVRTAVRRIRCGKLHPGLVGPTVMRVMSWLESHRSWVGLGHARLDRTYRDHDALAMAVAEWLAYDLQAWDLVQLRDHHPWPATPSVVLHAVNSSGGRERVDQQRLANLLGADLQPVHGSRHLVMIDRPEAICEAIFSRH